MSQVPVVPHLPPKSVLRNLRKLWDSEKKVFCSMCHTKHGMFEQHNTAKVVKGHHESHHWTGMKGTGYQSHQTFHTGPCEWCGST